MRLPGSIVPAFGAPLTGALFCFPGQCLKGAAYKKNMTSYPIYVLFAGAKEYFFTTSLYCLVSQKPDNILVCKNLNSIYCSNPFGKQQMSKPTTRQYELPASPLQDFLNLLICSRKEAQNAK
jgi:hypothetical protein